MKIYAAIRNVQQQKQTLDKATANQTNGQQQRSTPHGRTLCGPLPSHNKFITKSTLTATTTTLKHMQKSAQHNSYGD